MYYSRVTKKGQATIPSVYRKRFGIKEGDKVAFEETVEGILVRPMPDIADSAGALSRFAKADEVLREMLQARRKPFR